MTVAVTVMGHGQVLTLFGRRMVESRKIVENALVLFPHKSSNGTLRICVFPTDISST